MPKQAGAPRPRTLARLMLLAPSTQALSVAQIDELRHRWFVQTQAFADQRVLPERSHTGGKRAHRRGAGRGPGEILAAGKPGAGCPHGF